MDKATKTKIILFASLGIFVLVVLLCILVIGATAVVPLLILLNSGMPE